MDQLRNYVLIFSLGYLFAGCGSSPIGQEGSQGALTSFFSRESVTQVLVWSNHPEAANHAIQWLNEHQYLVVDRWIADDHSTVTPDPLTIVQRQPSLLAAAKRVGAPLVIFVTTREEPLEPDASSLKMENFRPKIIHIDIQGMNAETTDIVIGARASNIESHPTSDQLIMDLTSLALKEALKNPIVLATPSQERLQHENTFVQISRDPTLTEEKTSETLTKFEHNETRPILEPKFPNESQHLERENAPRENIPPPIPDSGKFIQEEELTVSQTHSSNDEPSTHDSSLGPQIASGALSILYTPFKIGYAMLGGLFGGLAYVMTAGNEEVAQTVWSSSLGGTYWLMPEHLRGETPIHFRGPSDPPIN